MKFKFPLCIEKYNGGGFEGIALYEFNLHY